VKVKPILNKEEVMEKENLLLTGMNQEKFDKAYDAKQVESCYDCGRHHEETCYGIRNCERVVTGSTTLKRVSLGVRKDGIEVYVFMCTECLLLRSALHSKFNNSDAQENKNLQLDNLLN